MNPCQARRRRLLAACLLMACVPHASAQSEANGRDGRLEILKLTLAAGADLKSTNRYGGTALIPACHHGHVEVVHELLKTSIAVDHVNKLGWTALLETVILGDGSPRYREIARLLLEHGASPAIADREGVTPLAHAQRRGHRDMLALLQAAARQ